MVAVARMLGSNLSALSKLKIASLGRQNWIFKTMVLKNCTTLLQFQYKRMAIKAYSEHNILTTILQKKTNSKAGFCNINASLL